MREVKVLIGEDFNARTGEEGRWNEEIEEEIKKDRKRRKSKDKN